MYGSKSLYPYGSFGKLYFSMFFKLIIILVIAAFLRLYRIGDYMEYLGDQGRDITIIRDFLKKYPVEILRWLALSHHYRSPLDFSEKIAEQAKSALENIYQEFYLLSKSTRERKNNPASDEYLEKYQKDFSEAQTNLQTTFFY